MSNNRRPFYWKFSSYNVLSDGMLKDISYGDYALMMTVKDKPTEQKNIHDREPKLK
ncbi:hypothetical protein SAMN05660462_02140 [Proteiniborus ethanoligenes]|uniref:Uncharacterized protein n=1 Tax=Proteiniborus ethanoligenes TaxID=415015 RepID=A0A1H3QY85_9FIRM|nr:hypothetical protein [Proteiniborus ethanoligenes]SDZ18336.1 hypothetical protein SAMN05660462_02140 [Proteiniborus ethanoligenes]